MKSVSQAFLLGSLKPPFTHATDPPTEILTTSSTVW